MDAWPIQARIWLEWALELLGKVYLLSVNGPLAIHSDSISTLPFHHVT